MKMLEEIVRILGKPFPEEETRFGYFRNLILLSLFVTLFLYIFRPFGISTLASKEFLICLGFGGMTFLGAAIYEVIVDQILHLKGKGEHWTFGKWILNNLGIMFFISLANFLFARLLIFGYIQWALFPQMIYSTFMIGIIPLVMLGGFSLLKEEKKYQSIAAEINQEEAFSSQKKAIVNPTVIAIPVNQIKYVEAWQNYAKIGYINAEGHLKIKTERITLKEILAKTEGSSIIRCHRSFLVNRDAIIATTGNAQGLLLTLADCDKLIPVSRTLVPVFRKR